MVALVKPPAPVLDAQISAAVTRNTKTNMAARLATGELTTLRTNRINALAALRIRRMSDLPQLTSAAIVILMICDIIFLYEGKTYMLQIKRSQSIVLS